MKTLPKNLLNNVALLRASSSTLKTITDGKEESLWRNIRYLCIDEISLLLKCLSSKAFRSSDNRARMVDLLRLDFKYKLEGDSSVFFS